MRLVLSFVKNVIEVQRFVLRIVMDVLISVGHRVHQQK